MLEGMREAPVSMGTVEAFVWSADRCLTERVFHVAAHYEDKRWLRGWRRRIRTYLE